MRQEIINKEEELRLAMLGNDVEKLDELIDESLVFTSPNGDVVTKQMDLDVHRLKLQKMSEMIPSNQVIRFYNNFVVVSVQMDSIGTYDKFDISGKYRYLRIWTIINDKWKVVAGSVVKIL